MSVSEYSAQRYLARSPVTITSSKSSQNRDPQWNPSSNGESFTLYS